MSARETVPAAGGASREEAGFSLLEILIGITVLLIGVAGLLSMQTSALRNSAYSRHSTEAAMLAQDKMEQLRTEDLLGAAVGPEVIDEQGIPDADGLYTRDWNIVDTGPFIDIEVTVTWREGGSADQVYRVTMRTRRTP